MRVPVLSWAVPEGNTPNFARFPLVLAAVAALMPAGVYAHHSIAGYYDSSRRVTIDGTIARVAFVSPHPYMEVDVPRGTASQRWRLEMDNRYEFEDIGITADSFKAGDVVTVTGSVARREPNQMYVERLRRTSDGFGFEQVNSRPRPLGRNR